MKTKNKKWVKKSYDPTEDINTSLTKWEFVESGHGKDGTTEYKSKYGEISTYGDIIWIFIKREGRKKGIVCHSSKSIDDFDRLMLELTSEEEVAYTKRGEAIPYHLVTALDEIGRATAYNNYNIIEGRLENL